ncbi:RNA-binding protein [Abyssisolibacter fermentans]|uniref:YlmH family RNA-binding protein n=1 Tax=Abyssisolibacter fermentans TaxID=1766203 RepID=UPI00082BF61F|nr:YlmH/Sll1252 family protein [Abyssisolibacter fermentans]
MGKLKNKSDYLNHINDKDQIITMRKIIDKIDRVITNRVVESTDFLDPYQRRLSFSILNRFPEIAYYEDGGYDNTERKMIIIHPSYIEKSSIDKYAYPIKFVMKGDFENISHRDCLGSLLSLGLKREKVGDIFILDRLIYVFLHKDVYDYVQYNMKKIKNTTVIAEYVNGNDIIIKENDDFLVSTINITSLRLDNVVSSSFNISRADSVRYIRNGYTKVNWQPILQPSRNIENGDLLSLRSKGRVLIEEILGTTKKGRIRLKIKKYL